MWWWGVTALVPALMSWAIYLVILRFSLLAALAWNVAVLYLTLGFRQFSHYFTDIRDALDHGDESEARRLLSESRHLDASELPASELLRPVIDHPVLAPPPPVCGRFLRLGLRAVVGLLLCISPVRASAAGWDATCCGAKAGYSAVGWWPRSCV